MTLTNEQIGWLKEAVISMAAHAAQTTGIASQSITMDEAKAYVKSASTYFTVKEQGDVITINYDMLKLASLGPLYGALPAALMSDKVKRHIAKLLQQSPVLENREIKI